MKRMMKMALAVLFTVGAMSATAQHKSGSLTIRVDGIATNQGSIIIGIKDAQNNSQKMIGKSVKSDTAGVVVVFEELPLGSHKILMFHDENGNSIIDISETGIPKEGYGVLKSDKDYFQYETEVVIDEKPQTILMTMKYLHVEF